MKKLILIFSLCCLVAGNMFAQCTNSSQFPSGSTAINTSGLVTTISTCSFDGEYSVITGAVSGQTLKFTSTTPSGVITIHSGSAAGPVIAFGSSPLSFANTFTGTVYAHWNLPGCGTASSCRTTTVQCTSCSAPLPDPCANQGSISCGVSQSVTLTGSGAGWNPSTCGFSTPGAEKVYTFTAPFTGVYTFNVTSGNGFIDWFFKSASAGCSSTGWTCIDDILTGSVTFTLTAGTYFILGDAESTSAITQTFNIDCTPPFDPCTAILPADCGVNQNVTLTGAGGNWNVTSCGFSTPGAEQVYSFTAPTTGNYTLNVSGGSGGYVDWFFKSTAGGCGPTGWTCIDDISGSGIVTFPLTAGTYYILADAEGTGSRTQTWNISCPAPAPANDLCSGAIAISCGGPNVTGNTADATADAAPTCNSLTVGTGGGVWYSVVGTGGFLTASTCFAGTNYDTKLHVYEGSCSGLTCVTANDDDANCTTGPGVAGFKSTVTWCATSGTTYYILVNGFLGAQGLYEMSLSCVQPTVTINAVAPLCQTAGTVTLSANLPGGVFSGPGVTGNIFDPNAAGPGIHTITYALCSVTATTTIQVIATPANDDVANAELLACGSSVVGNTTCATSETLGTCGTTDGTGGGVWYKIIGNGNKITLTTCNAVTDYDTKIRVYDGSPSALNCVTGNDDDNTCTTGPGVAGFKSRVEWCSTNGTAYYVLVHGFSSSVGNFQLESSCSPVGPSIVCSGPISGNLDANCSFVLADYTGLTSVTDDCPGTTLTQSPAAGATVTGAGAHEITFTVTDAGGNTATCSITLTLTDITPPTAVCQPYTASLDANGNATVTVGDVNNGSSDACGIASTSIDNSAFTCTNVGSNNVVTLTVVDVNGLSSTCTSVITVVDNVAPVITCPANITVTAPVGQCSTTVSYTVTSTDACGSSVTSVTPASGSVFGLGNTTVYAVATDVNGNTSDCSFTVHVNGTGHITLWGVPCDVTASCSSIPAAPAIVSCPSQGNGGSGSGPGHHGCNQGNHGSYGGHHGSGHGSNGHQCNYGNGGSGSGQNYAGYNGYITNPCTNGSGSGSGHGSGHGSGSGSGHGSGHWSGGNHGSNSCNVYCVSHSCGVYAKSNCGPCPTVTFNETIVPGTGPGCYTIIRTWTATDAFGNSVSQSQTITVVDNVRPNINCPNNITVCVPNSGNSRVVTFNVSASDNCGTPTVTAVPASGSSFPVGNTYVTATASDGCGNTRTCQFRVRVERRSNCNSRLSGEPEAGDEVDEPTLSINAYPNPTNGLLEVEIFCQDCNGDVTYPMTVTDLFGKVIIKKDVVIAGGKANIDLSLIDYASGVYMINVNGLFTRVMKQ